MTPTALPSPVSCSFTRVLFSSLLVASIGVAIQLAFTSQFVEAGRALRSASVFGVCLNFFGAFDAPFLIRLIAASIR